MNDNHTPTEPAHDTPTIVGSPVPVRVKVDPIAYGVGRQTHWERATDDEEDQGKHNRRHEGSTEAALNW